MTRSHGRLVVVSSSRDKILIVDKGRRAKTGGIMRDGSCGSRLDCSISPTTVPRFMVVVCYEKKFIKPKPRRRLQCESPCEFVNVPKPRPGLRSAQMIGTQGGGPLTGRDEHRAWLHLSGSLLVPAMSQLQRRDQDIHLDSRMRMEIRWKRDHGKISSHKSRTLKTFGRDWTVDAHADAMHGTTTRAQKLVMHALRHKSHGQ